MHLKTVKPFIRPQIMGVLNVTPDSFSDGGKYLSPETALQAALTLIEEGADVIDIGGESTRPGAIEVSVQEELDRVIPVIERLTSVIDVPISVDTMKPDVMQAALAFNVWMINDVNALQAQGALETVKNTNCQICLMHKQGLPATMQNHPTYEKSVTEVVRQFLLDRISVCESQGIDRDRLWIDPGFGFGKTLDHNLTLLKQIDQLTLQDIPMMIGVSRKSLLGQIIQRPVHARVFAGIAAALFAIQRGVKMIRTHDVRATKEAIIMWCAIESASEG